MAFPRRAGRSRRTLIVLLVLASLTMLAIGFDSSGPSQSARSAFATRVPARPIGGRLGVPAGRPTPGAASPATATLKKENERLRRRLDRVQGDDRPDKVQSEQIAELKKLLGIKFLGDLPTRTGRVVSGPLSSFDRTIEIDLGTGDGVKKGMAVVTDAGLVGKIVRADSARSDVSLITDPSFEVGFQLRKSTGDRGHARQRLTASPSPSTTAASSRTSRWPKATTSPPPVSPRARSRPTSRSVTSDAVRKSRRREPAGAPDRPDRRPRLAQLRARHPAGPALVKTDPAS